jgi:hypothetical protein
MPSKNLQHNGLLYDNMGISHLDTCIHQQTDHGMEREENYVMERVRINEAALNEKHKSHNLHIKIKKLIYVMIIHGL